MSSAKNQFKDFIGNHRPAQVSRHLRDLLLGYLEERLISGLPIDFQQYLWELNDLFSILDNAEREIQKEKNANKGVF